MLDFYFYCIDLVKMSEWLIHQSDWSVFEVQLTEGTDLDLVMVNTVSEYVM